MNKGWKIAKICLRNSHLAYAIAGITALSMLLQTVIYALIYLNTDKSYDNSNLSIGCVLWLAPLLSAIFIPAKHFRKIVNLGGRRDGFIAGSFLVCALMALGGALANTVIHYTFDYFMQEIGFFTGPMGGTLNLVEAFGWVNNGPVLAFLQQFAFLFLAMSAIYTLTAMQGKWYGWATDAAIGAIVAIFVPIEALRPFLVNFLFLITACPNAYLHITVCLILGTVIFALNKPIFARKAI